MIPPRVNGAHRAYAGRNRSWRRAWLAPAGVAAVVLAAAGVFAATRPAAQPEPVSAAAGAQPNTAAVPTAPYTGGMEVREDGPTAVKTTGCAP